MTATIHHGDCLDVLRATPDNSVDAICCDPPYGLSNTSPDKVTETIIRWAQGDREYVPQGKGFMGASWDAFVPPVAVWDECLRVLKPGGHLVAFAGSRTQDLMGLAIRLAGFDIRENLAWLYGSGFPKSLDIGKAIDKTNGEAGRLHKFTTWMRTTGLTSHQLNDVTGTNMGGHYLTAASQPAIPTPDLWAKIRPLVEEVPPWVDELVDRVEAEREVIRTETRMNEPSGIVNIGQGERTQIERKITAPSTDEAKRWQGWGTALKPGHEPIILARKPIQGTVASNTLTWGTGGLNIDKTRIAGEVPATTRGRKAAVSGDNRSATAAGMYAPSPVVEVPANPAGRWPANVVLDPDAAKALDQQSGTLKSGARSGVRAPDQSRTTYGTFEGGDSGKTFASDEGGASRFFKVVEPDPPFMYAAKAPKKERPSYTTEDGQTVQHATVKPLSIMQWLVRLVTPEGGTVLDPFAGSGTTVEAALLEGFNVIGIEREAAYLPLIQQRIDRANDVLPMAS